MTAERAIPWDDRGVRVTLPLRANNPSNGSHGHWPVVARNRAQARSLVHLALPGHLRGARLSWPILVTLVRMSPSSGLDDDNLRGALKAVRDQVAEELGLANDRDPRVTWEYGQERASRRDLTLANGYGVRIEIRSGVWGGDPGRVEDRMTTEYDAMVDAQAAGEHGLPCARGVDDASAQSFADGAAWGAGWMAAIIGMGQAIREGYDE